MTVWTKVGEDETITVAQAIKAIKNFARYGLGKTVFHECSWANRSGVTWVVAILRSVGAMVGFTEFEGEEFEPMTDDTELPVWFYSFQVRPWADGTGHIALQIFKGKLEKIQQEEGTAVPRTYGSLAYLETIGYDWCMHGGGCSFVRCAAGNARVVRQRQ